MLKCNYKKIIKIVFFWLFMNLDFNSKAPFDWKDESDIHWEQSRPRSGDAALHKGAEVNESERGKEVRQDETTAADFIRLQHKTLQAAAGLLKRLSLLFKEQGLNQDSLRIEQEALRLPKVSIGSSLNPEHSLSLFSRFLSVIMNLGKDVKKEAETYQALREQLVQTIAVSVNAAAATLLSKPASNPTDSPFNHRLIKILVEEKNNRKRLKLLTKEIKRQLIAEVGSLFSQEGAKVLKATFEVEGKRFHETTTPLKVFDSALASERAQLDLEKQALRAERKALDMEREDLDQKVTDLAANLEVVVGSIELLEEGNADELRELLEGRDNIQQEMRKLGERLANLGEGSKRVIALEKREAALAEKYKKLEEVNKEGFRSSNQLQAEGVVAQATMNAYRTALKDNEGALLVTTRRSGAICDASDLSRGAMDLIEEREQLQNEVYYMRLKFISDPSNDTKEMRAKCEAMDRRIDELTAQEAARKQVLLSQATPLIMDALQEKREALEFGLRAPNSSFALQGGKFSYTQMGLVDQQRKGKINKSNAEERAMMRDAEYIFQFLNDKRVLFDGKGFIDEKGVIHAPYQLTTQVELVSEMTYYNFSTQGTYSNKEEQEKINDVAWEKTQQKASEYRRWLKKKGVSPKDPQRKEFEVRLRSLQQRYNNKESNETLAAEMVEFESMLGSAISVNCMSGKDRTGDLVNILHTRAVTKSFTGYRPLFLSRTLADIKHLFTEKVAKAHKLREKVAREVVKKGATLHITWANTGIRSLKLDKMIWGLEGLTFRERLRMGYLGRYIKS